jgi:hypothetical protein
MAAHFAEPVAFFAHDKMKDKAKITTFFDIAIFWRQEVNNHPPEWTPFAFDLSFLHFTKESYSVFLDEYDLGGPAGKDPTLPQYRAHFDRFFYFAFKLKQKFILDPAVMFRAFGGGLGAEGGGITILAPRRGQNGGNAVGTVQIELNAASGGGGGSSISSSELGGLLLASSSSPTTEVVGGGMNSGKGVSTVDVAASLTGGSQSTSGEAITAEPNAAPANENALAKIYTRATTAFTKIVGRGGNVLGRVA